MRDRFTNEAKELGQPVFSLLNTIVDDRTAPDAYGQAMTDLGRFLGEVLSRRYAFHGRTVCVAFTVEDADYLARGIVQVLEKAGGKVTLACFWNRRDKAFDVDWLDIAPIVQEYIEPLPSKLDHLVILKSIISGACVVRTNLLRLLDAVRPSFIHIVAPVVLAGAEGRLAKLLPQDLVSRFKFLNFAEDVEKGGDGNVIPGIGGEIYERLGLGNEIEKNLTMPKLVEERLSAVL